MKSILDTDISSFKAILEIDTSNHSIVSVAHDNRASVIIDGINCNDGLMGFWINSTSTEVTVLDLKVNINDFVNGENRLTKKQLEAFTIKEILKK